MYQKFYKMLIIGNFQVTILHIQTCGVGGMGRWGDGIFGGLILHGCMDVFGYPLTNQ
jgi:hypothetical protein